MLDGAWFKPEEQCGYMQQWNCQQFRQYWEWKSSRHDVIVATKFQEFQDLKKFAKCFPIWSYIADIIFYVIISFFNMYLYIYMYMHTYNYIALIEEISC